MSAATTITNDRLERAMRRVIKDNTEEIATLRRKTRENSCRLNYNERVYQLLRDNLDNTIEELDFTIEKLDSAENRLLLAENRLQEFETFQPLQRSTAKTTRRLVTRRRALSNTEGMPHLVLAEDFSDPQEGLPLWISLTH